MFTRQRMKNVRTGSLVAVVTQQLCQSSEFESAALGT